MNDVELLFGNDPAHAWVIRNFLTPEQISNLQVTIEVLEKEIPYGKPADVSAPCVRAIASGGLGGWGVNELPRNAVHVARNVESVQSSDPALSRVKQLAHDLGDHFFHQPMETTFFTRPIGDAVPGLAGHADIQGGFISLFLTGEKTFDLLPTLLRHQFGDNFATDEHLVPYADPRFERISVHVEPGDLLYCGSHVIHWVGNKPGSTQHLRFRYPTYLLLDKIFDIMMAHQALNRLSPKTVDVLATVAPSRLAAYDSFTACAKHLAAQNEVIADLIRQDIFETPWQDLPRVPANPDQVLAALTQHLPQDCAMLASGGRPS